VNAPRIVDEIMSGQGAVATSDMSDFYWAFDSALRRPVYDVRKADELLERRGWTRGANGIRVKNGTPLSMQIVYGQGSVAARQIAIQAQADLRTIGIDVSIKPYPESLLFAPKSMGGILYGGKFDLAEVAWASGGDPDDSSSWMCAMTPPNGNNVGHYCDPKLDAAERRALSTYDRGVRKAAYAQTQALLLQDAAADFLYYARAPFAINANLKNFTPNGLGEGWNAYEWAL
jgi:peptide/nickel transport system substrate-binding protein